MYDWEKADIKANREAMGIDTEGEMTFFAGHSNLEKVLTEENRNLRAEVKRLNRWKQNIVQIFKKLQES